MKTSHQLKPPFLRVFPAVCVFFPKGYLGVSHLIPIPHFDVTAQRAQCRCGWRLAFAPRLKKRTWGWRKPSNYHHSPTAERLHDTGTRIQENRLIILIHNKRWIQLIKANRCKWYQLNMIKTKKIRFWHWWSFAMMSVCSSSTVTNLVGGPPQSDSILEIARIFESCSKFKKLVKEHLQSLVWHISHL